MKNYKDQIASCLDLLLLLLNASPKNLRAQAAPLRLFRLFRLFPGFVVSSSQSRNADPAERLPLRGLFVATAENGFSLRSAPVEPTHRQIKEGETCDGMASGGAG